VGICEHLTEAGGDGIERVLPGESWEDHKFSSPSGAASFRLERRDRDIIAHLSQPVGKLFMCRGLLLTPA
jgi:hypothetical protein